MDRGAPASAYRLAAGWQLVARTAQAPQGSGLNPHGLTSRENGRANATLVHLSHRPEIDLLMACTLPRGVPGAADRVRAFLEAGVDWPKVNALAGYHGVLPVLYMRLTELPAGSVPEHVLAQFATDFRRNTLRNLYLTGELVRTLKAFADEGIPVLPFKGPLLAQQAYGNLGLRVFADLDLLIRPREVGRVLELLASEGYRPNPRLEWVTAGSWTRWSPEVLLHNKTSYIDLHWMLLLDHYPIQLDPETPWRSATTVELGGVGVRSLPPEVLLQVLAVHGGKHCWERLCLVADIAWLLDAHAGIDLPQVIAAAEASGCRRPALLALALVKDVQQTKLPAKVEELVEQDRAVQLLRAKVWKRLMEGPLTAPGTRELFSFAAGLSKHRTRTIRHLCGLLLNPTEAEWEAFRLPAALFVLYVPYRLWRLLRKYLRRT